MGSICLSNRKSLVAKRLLMDAMLVLAREAGTLYALFGFFDSLLADSDCRRHGYGHWTAYPARKTKNLVAMCRNPGD